MQVQWHGSPGQLGLRVTWFLGHWVAGSQNVTQFHVWFAVHSVSAMLYIWRALKVMYLYQILTHICLLCLILKLQLALFRFCRLMKHYILCSEKCMLIIKKAVFDANWFVVHSVSAMLYIWWALRVMYLNQMITHFCLLCLTLQLQLALFRFYRLVLWL